MSYQVLARKWRPRSFGEMVGQEHVLKALINALDHNRLHHAYLFTGTRGVGKTTVARILAKCLNCETGVGSTPCGVCSTCTEINEGRFVDLIEVDAASRTKVEDTRELLDNVQYSPTSGRFKIYLIDEVHMLSTSSFNALLKTLEEPPEHVKFLLATTDPQKLPATILSRCLQFNLKNMSPEKIVSHLQTVLGEEMVPCEDSALWQLARSADGSMRDALSLTDQAIAFGNGKVSEIDVTSMLGTIDHKFIQNIIEALIHSDGAKLLNAVALFAEHAPDYIAALADLQTLLHRIAIAQALPEALDNSYGDRQSILHYSTQLAPEDVQLFYQTALMGQRDISLCQIPRTGFEMVLLRMLAFKPQGVADIPTQALPVVEPLADQEPSANQEPSVVNASSTNDEGLSGNQPVANTAAVAQNLAEADSSKKPITAMENTAEQPSVAIADAPNIAVAPTAVPNTASKIDNPQPEAQRPPWEAAPQAHAQPAVVVQSAQHEVTAVIERPLASEVPAAVREPSANKEPSANREPSAINEPSANREPSANIEPSTNGEFIVGEEPSANQKPLANQKSLADQKPSANQKPLADKKPSANQKPIPAQSEYANTQAYVEQPAPARDSAELASEQAYDDYASMDNQTGAHTAKASSATVAPTALSRSPEPVQTPVIVPAAQSQPLAQPLPSQHTAQPQVVARPSAMDAFNQAGQLAGAHSAPVEQASSSSRALKNIRASQKPTEPALSFDQFSPDQWIRVYKQLPISGVLKMTAANLICTAVQPSEIYFLQDEQAVGLLNTEHALGLGEALTQYFGFPLRANIQVSALDGSTETPAQNKARLREERRLHILDDLRGDHFVQSLQQHFAATLDEHSLTITEED